MRLILTVATLYCLSFSTQAMAVDQDLFCESSEVSSTLFLHASRSQYVLRISESSSKINDTYNINSTQIADNDMFSIQMLEANQVLVKMKKSGLEFILSCK